jgi:hypothetical protein
MLLGWKDAVKPLKVDTPSCTVSSVQVQVQVSVLTIDTAVTLPEPEAAFLAAHSASWKRRSKCSSANATRSTSKSCSFAGTGGAKRAGCRKYWEGPANKGDLAIQIGYTPWYHRRATGNTGSAVTPPKQDAPPEVHRALRLFGGRSPSLSRKQLSNL